MLSYSPIKPSEPPYLHIGQKVIQIEVKQRAIYELLLKIPLNIHVSAALSDILNKILDDRSLSAEMLKRANSKQVNLQTQEKDQILYTINFPSDSEVTIDFFY